MRGVKATAIVGLFFFMCIVPPIATSIVVMRDAAITARTIAKPPKKSDRRQKTREMLPDINAWC